MSLYLGVLLFSFIFTSLAAIPFIDLLYYLQFTLKKSEKFKSPVGGGILIISIVTFLFVVLFSIISRFGVYIETSYPLRSELNVIFLTFILFGLIGLYEDLINIFGQKQTFKLKNIIIVVASLLVAYILNQNLNITYLNLPFVGTLELGLFYIPIAAGMILLFSKGFSAANSVDGLVAGCTLISVIAFWFLSVTQLDTPLSLFIGLWTGALIAFLYFNVFPARILLGKSGSLSFGATFVVIGLLLGKPAAILVIGSVFIFTAIASFFKFDPFKWLVNRGWPEPKIMLRSWLLVLITAFIGLWLS